MKPLQAPADPSFRLNEPRTKMNTSRFRSTCLAAWALCLMAAPLPLLAKETVPLLIKRLSQEFSDASAAGDAATLDRLLDDRVTFMVENGTVMTKKDVVASASPRSGSRQVLVQSDFGVELYGDVAVTRFTDTSTLPFHGQVLNASYRSTEVWKNGRKGWKLISSQTLAVASDPPAVSLPAAMLDEYVGRYEADADFALVIVRDGDALAGSSSGRTYPIKAEVRDVLFTPGQAGVRRIIQRDSNGVVTGLLSRRDGHDLVLKRVQ
jgi:ketosteroid isomerase-like protein